MGYGWVSCCFSFHLILTSYSIPCTHSSVFFNVILFSADYTVTISVSIAGTVAVSAGIVGAIIYCLYKREQQVRMMHS